MRGYMLKLYSMLVRALNLISMGLAWVVVIFWLSVWLFSMIALFILGMAAELFHTMFINKKHTRR